MNLSLQKKLILFTCLGLISLFLLGWLGVFPLFNKIKGLSQEYLSNQEILIKLNQRESLAKELQNNYQEREADLTEIARVFLSSEEMVGFISNMETVAQQTDNFFEIKAINPYTPLTDEESPFLNFQISLWGNFSSLLLFLANLENNPYPPYRLVEIENLTIRRLAAKDLVRFDFPLGEGDLETILSIKIYTQ
ncbi:MAG: hypothetical protein ISS88_03330 [Candidatus Portnoybacteria bacterium]|nr:hypothetical protein [Candidatus Portnoybacteria bacterium]